jgi:hypothetical protein
VPVPKLFQNAICFCSLGLAFERKQIPQAIGNIEN